MAIRYNPPAPTNVTVDELAARLGYQYGPSANLVLALKPSPKDKVKKKQAVGLNNDRLEFLGDAILTAILSDYLYDTNPTLGSGDMSEGRKKLENNDVLAKLGARLGLLSFIQVVNNDTKPLSDAFEAIIGAMYLDFGFEQTLNFCLAEIIPRLETSEDTHTVKKMYATSIAQEYVHRMFGSAVPLRFETEQVQGTPSHAPVYTSMITLPDGTFATGEGRRKDEAATNASIAVVDLLTEQKRLPMDIYARRSGAKTK